MNKCERGRNAIVVSVVSSLRQESIKRVSKVRSKVSEESKIRTYAAWM